MSARILVVDDDSLAGELICEILRSAGMDASFLTSSTEAAEPLKREKYHAVFLDMRMPPPDGVELARQIRASRVNASTVIVMITGEEERTLMKRAFEAGVEFFLFKPVARNKLLKLICVAEGPIERERRRFTQAASALLDVYFRVAQEIRSADAVLMAMGVCRISCDA